MASATLYWTDSYLSQKSSLEGWSKIISAIINMWSQKSSVSS